MFGRIYPGRHLFLGFSLLGSFDYCFSLLTHLCAEIFYFFMTVLVGYVSGNVSISSRLSNLWVYNCCQCLIILCISMVSVLMSPLSLIILFETFFFVSLAEDLSIFFQKTASFISLSSIFHLFLN